LFHFTPEKGPLVAQWGPVRHGSGPNDCWLRKKIRALIPKPTLHQKTKRDLGGNDEHSLYARHTSKVNVVTILILQITDRKLRLAYSTSGRRGRAGICAINASIVPSCLEPTYCYRAFIHLVSFFAAEFLKHWWHCFLSFLRLYIDRIFNYSLVCLFLHSRSDKGFLNFLISHFVRMVRYRVYAFYLSSSGILSSCGNSKNQYLFFTNSLEV
jgi:hypothetical protein